VRPGRLRATLALAAVLLLAVVSVLVYTRATAPRPLRILLVGDSVTQGSAGDWTWRFRLWGHLTASDVDVDLVGPRNDLLDRATSTFGSQEYADPHFDRDHAARWGMALAAMDQPIGDLVRRYRPDVVVEMLGLNDLAWLEDDPAKIEEELTGFVADARRENPAVDVVLGQLPQVWCRGVPQLNTRLPALARALDTSSSRVVVARPEDAFVEGVDTYDPGHLAATGEVKVAAGVADALARLGIGTPYPRPLPRVPEGPRETAFLLARPTDGGAFLVWRPPPGADNTYVWVRDLTVDEPWTRLPFPVEGTSWQTGEMVNGHVYAFRVQSAKGSAVADDLFSNAVTVRPGPQQIPTLPAP
jgi:lysophospholipase L1-like esterase